MKVSLFFLQHQNSGFHWLPDWLLCCWEEDVNFLATRYTTDTTPPRARPKKKRTFQWKRDELRTRWMSKTWNTAR